MSIRSKYEAELNTVFDKLVDMCHKTELAIEKSINALKQRDNDLAREVIRARSLSRCLSVITILRARLSARIKTSITPKGR